MNMQFPVIGNEPNLDEMFIYLKSLHALLKNLHLTGTQLSMVTSDQITKMTTENKFSQAGKLFYNTDTNEFYRAKISGGILVLETW